MGRDAWEGRIDLPGTFEGVAQPAVPGRRRALVRQTVAEQDLVGGLVGAEQCQLTITLDPMPTQRETAAVSELCSSLTETQTRYPGTGLILRYAIKERL